MADAVIRGMFQGLVQRIGGVDAAAAVLEARSGVGHKGTISKMCAGQIGVTVASVMALEEALGEYPVSQYLAQRRGNGLVAGGSISDLAAQASVSAGAAQRVLFMALAEKSAGGAGVTANEASDIAASAIVLREIADRIVKAAREAMGHPAGGPVSSSSHSGGQK